MDTSIALSILAIVATVYLLWGRGRAASSETAADYLAGFERVMALRDGWLVRKRDAAPCRYLEFDLPLADHRLRIAVEAVQADDEGELAAWSTARLFLGGHNGADVRLQICRRSFLAEMATALGTDELLTGFREFDRDFVIRTNDQEAGQRLVTIEVQRYARRLLSFASATNTSIEVDRHAVVVAARDCLGCAHVGAWIDAISELGRAFLEASKGPRPDKGPNPVEEPSPVEAPNPDNDQNCADVIGEDAVAPMRKPWLPQGPICRVCGDPVVAAPVMCHRCRAQYHRPCWDYGERCNAYGCGATELA